MAKQIAWTEQARADVRGIDRETAIDLLHRLARFLSTEEGDVKRLTDIDPPELRLRLGVTRPAVCRKIPMIRAKRYFASLGPGTLY